LPRLSSVAEQFLQDSGRDTATAAEISRALAEDAVLQGWVLRQANSGFCKLNRPIGTIAEACVVLGLQTVTRLLYAACTRDLLGRPLACYRYPGNGFWLHGLATGTAARRLALHLQARSPLAPEAAQIAGLLHDVGKLLIDDRLPRAGGPRHVTPAAEIAACGHDHGMHSAAVAMAWSLPAEIVLALAYHHAPAAHPAGRLLAVADHLIRHWGVGSETYPQLDLDPPLAELTALGVPLDLDAALLSRWCSELPPVLAGLAEMVKVIGHGTPPDLDWPERDGAAAERDRDQRGQDQRRHRHARYRRQRGPEPRARAGARRRDRGRR
jgi:HD-like signal output (HDOD) protein